jgi:hypothetical protein
MISLSSLTNNHVVKIIHAGKSDTLIIFDIPKGKKLYIDRIACSYYPNTFIDFIVDGFIERIKREIPINNPEIFDPPILCKSFLKVVGYNNDSIDHSFEFYIDGYLI